MGGACLNLIVLVTTTTKISYSTTEAVCYAEVIMCLLYCQSFPMCNSCLLCGISRCRYATWYHFSCPAFLWPFLLRPGGESFNLWTLSVLCSVWINCLVTIITSYPERASQSGQHYVPTIILILILLCFVPLLVLLYPKAHPFSSNLFVDCGL